LNPNELNLKHVLNDRAELLREKESKWYQKTKLKFYEKEMLI
jgi:hypothetical protein